MTDGQLNIQYELVESNFQNQLSLKVSPYWYFIQIFLQNQFPILIEDICLEKRLHIFFQHDGAPPHEVRQLLNLI